MIFVTVGNHYQGFERLVRKMDEIAGRIDEKVIMQIGTTEYKPVNAEYFDFDEYGKIQELNSSSRIVVSHAGVGSILTALEQKKPIIIVPRLKNFSEAMDDHQLEIAEAMSENHNVKAVYDVKELENCLTKNLNFLDESKDNLLVNSVKNYLSSIT